MPEKVMLQVPLNRVEGDLEINVQVQDGVVSDAWSSGIMYRGFENLLKGRGAMDGLVITPRICGICGTAHLIAATRALEMIQGVTPPPAACRLRNVALMVEKMQSDMRHGALMFAPDFTNPAYRDQPLFDTPVGRYTPLKGPRVPQPIRPPKELQEMTAIAGGQGPLSSYMIPGGLTAMPSTADLIQCSLIISRFKSWYERQVLGCSIAQWMALKSKSDLELWLRENTAHRDSEIGFHMRFSREIGLDTIGRGHGYYISYTPDAHRLGEARSPQEKPPGFAHGTKISGFDQQHIEEYVDYSWYQDYSGGRHPFDGETNPYATGDESKKYSWCKAPRYAGRPAETGPLAEMVISGDPLVADLLDHDGPSVHLRQLARLIRPAHLIPMIESLLAETTCDDTFYEPCGKIVNGQGYGLVEATRGALGHWVEIEEGKIKHYQVITPTAWNASPRDDKDVRGPWEEALIGTPVADDTNPVALGHVVRSYDACLYCSIHVLALRAPGNTRRKQSK